MFYGWIILLVLCYAHYFLLCGWLYTYGPTLSAMIADFGSTLTMASAARTSQTLVAALLALVVGWVIAKRSAKLCLLVGAVAGTLGSALMAFYIDSMPQYFVCCTVLLATMTTFGSGIAAQTIISRWFKRRRGLALGFLLASGGVGGFTYPALTTFLIQHTGTWRTIWIFVLFGCVTSFVLSLVFLKDRPEQKGTYPDGIPPEQQEPESNTPSRIQRSAESWEQKEAIRTPFFRTIIFAQICTSFSMTCITGYTVVTFVDKGLTLVQASMVLSVFAFVNFFTRLLSGVAMDRFEPKYVYGACMFVMATACMMVPFVSSVGLAYCFGGLFGLAFGFTVIGPQTLQLNAFGVENFGQINSVQVMVSSLTASLLTLVPGVIRDQTGSFNLLYIILFVILVCGGLAIVKARTPVRVHACPQGEAQQE